MRRNLYNNWNPASVKPETGRPLLVRQEGLILYENGFVFDGKDFVGRNGAANVLSWIYA